MWLVSLDLAGGLINPGGPSTGAPGPDNFIVAFVDAKTGRVGMTTAGYRRCSRRCRSSADNAAGPPH
jgi:hypothetical protein